MTRIGDYVVSARRSDSGVGWCAEVVCNRRFSDTPLHIASLAGYGSEADAEAAGRRAAHEDQQRILANLERAISAERSSQ